MSANPTIGMVTCPLCNEPAAVRKDKAGRFYYISAAGRISPSSEFGQKWFVENAVIWGVDGTPPDDAPEWIAEGRSWPENSQSKHRSSRKNSPTEAAEPEPVEDQEPAPAEPESVSQDDDDDGGFGSFLGIS